MVTIKDISKISGYSVTTVSKTLNNYDDIPKKTKDKILKICDEVGYIPNASARSLVTQKSFTIGIIFEEITGVGLQHPLFSKILESFKSKVELKGYDIMFLSNSGESEKESYLHHSKRKNVDAVLILCGDFYRDDFIEMYTSDIPTVVIDYEHENLCSVRSSDKVGVEQAIEYLVKLGHKKIATIHGGLESAAGQLRLDYFVEYTKKYKCDVKEGYIVPGQWFTKDDGYRAMKKILELKDLPTAVFCASDMLAIGAIQAIRQKGYDVPKDFSIIGYDGIDIGQL